MLLNPKNNWIFIIFLNLIRLLLSILCNNEFFCYSLESSSHLLYLTLEPYFLCAVRSQIIHQKFYTSLKIKPNTFPSSPPSYFLTPLVSGPNTIILLLVLILLYLPGLVSLPILLIRLCSRVRILLFTL